MSRHDDTKAQPGDAEFAARVAARLQDSADALDARTRSRLNQARQAALDEMTPRSAWRRPSWLTAAVTAGIAAVALVLWRPVAEGPQPYASPALDVPDLELLMTDENLDMLEDLEFYTWLAAADLDSGAAG